MIDFESKAEAYQRFKRIFAGHPELVRGVSPDALPASLLLEVSDERIQSLGGFSGLQVMLGRIPGVEAVSPEAVRPNGRAEDDLDAWARSCPLLQQSPTRP